MEGVVFKNVNIIKNKERLWKCSTLRESKETWQLNAIPDRGMNSVLEEEKNAFIKDITGPTDKTGTWTEDLMNVLYQYEFTEVDNCAVVI